MERVTEAQGDKRTSQSEELSKLIQSEVEAHWG